MMLVTIMPGPGDQFANTELAPDTCTVQTMLWTGCCETAVEYIRDNYEEREVLAPCAFRAEVLARKKGCKP